MFASETGKQPRWKLGWPCPKVRLSKDRLKIESFPCWKARWGGGEEVSWLPQTTKLSEGRKAFKQKLQMAPYNRVWEID